MSIKFKDEGKNLTEEIQDSFCNMFNVFSQGFLSSESLKSIPIYKKITNVDELTSDFSISDEKRESMKLAIIEKNKNRFSKKNIGEFVKSMLNKNQVVKASEISINSKRDIIRIIFIYLYGKNNKVDYIVDGCNEIINKEGFRFRDFEIKRRIH